VIKQGSIFLWHNYLNVLSTDSFSQPRNCFLRYNINWRHCWGSKKWSSFPWVFFQFPVIVQWGGSSQLCLLFTEFSFSQSQTRGQIPCSRRFHDTLLLMVNKIQIWSLVVYYSPGDSTDEGFIRWRIFLARRWESIMEKTCIRISIF